MTNARIVSRRWLVKLGGLAAVSGFAKELIAPGVQLYTVHNEVLKQPWATLQAIAEIGYREVEMLRNQVKTLAPLLKRVNLTPLASISKPLFLPETGRHGTTPICRRLSPE